MDTIPPQAGLCQTCRHARLIISDKGGRFVQCGLSQSDSQFAKYPKLPVLLCAGFHPADPTQPHNTDR